MRGLPNRGICQFVTNGPVGVRGLKTWSGLKKKKNTAQTTYIQTYRDRSMRKVRMVLLLVQRDVLHLLRRCVWGRLSSRCRLDPFATPSSPLARACYTLLPNVQSGVGAGARPPRLTPFCHADLLLAMLPAAPQPLASTMHWSARAVLTTVGRGEGGRGEGGRGRGGGGAPAASREAQDGSRAAAELQMCARWEEPCAESGAAEAAASREHLSSGGACP